MSDAITRLLTEAEQRPVLTRPAKSHLRAWLAALLLLGYAGIVAAATLSPTPLDSGYRGTIDKVLGMLHRNGMPEWFGYAQLEFSANVAMFVPLGFLIALALPWRGVWASFLLVPALSAAIEWAQGQFLAERFASLQDVAANSLGGFLGILLALLVRAMVHARDRKVIARAQWDATFGAQRR